jgi:peptidoglycan/LPS O-acetylase OafA/YrhL
MGGIRLLLALVVVLSHAGVECLVGSRLAVQLFYMVSGFLITFILTSSNRYRSAKVFYVSRALRIYPVYFVVLLISLFFPVYGAETAQVYQQLPWAASVFMALSNIGIFFQELSLFMRVTDGAVHIFAGGPSEVLVYRALFVPQAWSLSLELMFYVIAPFVVRSRLLTLGVFLMSVGLRAWFFQANPAADAEWSYRFLPFELALFMLGALSCQWGLPIWQRMFKHRALPALGASLILVAILSFGLWPGDGLSKTITLFALFAVLLPCAFRYQQTSKVDRVLAELSYPVYICHLMVFSVFAAEFARMPPSWAIAAKLAASVAIAWLLKVFVADYFERMRHNMTSRI